MRVVEVELTPQQEKLWSDTKVALWWWCPAFTHILLSMLQDGKSKKEAKFTRDPSVPIAATNGTSLMLNPDTFFQFSLYQRIFIIAHEILHCILNHCVIGYQFKMSGKVTYPDGASLDYDHDTMNIAMDLVINDMLVFSKTGEMPERNGAKVGWHAPDLGGHMDSALDVYRKIFNPRGGGGRKGNGPVGTGGNKAGGQHGDKAFDNHLDPGQGEGKDPQSAANDRNDGEWKTAVAAAMAAAKAMGKLPAGLERVFGEVLEPKVDWREHIKALMARRVGSGSNDWRRPDRRLITRDISLRVVRGWVLVPSWLPVIRPGLSARKSWICSSPRWLAFWRISGRSCCSLRGAMLTCTVSMRQRTAVT